jgi:predicted nuclease of predicted toxin-antitoxin system
MKFLIDENLPPAFAVWLVANGHDALHVARANLRGASDAAIAA